MSRRSACEDLNSPTSLRALRSCLQAAQEASSLTLRPRSSYLSPLPPISPRLLLPYISPPSPPASPRRLLLPHLAAISLQVKAEMKALVTSMARVTHRRLEWTESEPEEAEVEPRSWKDVLLCKGNKTPKHVMCVFESKGSSAARVLQGGLQPKLGRPLLLSGQWSANYHELAEARNKLDATQLGGTPEEIAEAEQKMRAVRLKVSEHIEDAIALALA